MSGTGDHTHDGEGEYGEGVHDHAESNDPSLFNPDLYASVDNLAGTTGPNGKPIWSAEQAATYLFRAGAGYGTTGNMVMPTGGDLAVLTYGFHTGQASLEANGYVYESGGRYFGLSEYFNFAPFTEAQKAATREAFQYWDDVVSTEFVETNINDADIALGNYTNQPGTQAYARLLANTVTSNPYINDQIRDIGGDVWVNRNTASNFQLDEGGYGMNTLVHEIGHGFGMLHPGDYNASPGVSLSYAANAEYYQDTRSYSILSYWNPRDIGARDFDFTVMNIAYGATPMVHDILAMQLKYGAEMTTRTGDTVYGFNSTAGRDAFDFVKTPAPMMAIWDAGGIDTLDASGYKTNQVINLTPGSLSSIGGITAEEFPTFAQVNANRAAAGMAPTSQATYDANKNVFMTNPGLYGRITDNVGIAYGATIENAVGGSGHDTMIGNGADNVLSGNAGNDLIASGLGNDTLDGGLGNDEMLGGAGNDLYVVGEAGDIVTELGGEGTDTVKSAIDYTLGDNVEMLVLTGSAKSGTGNGLDNTLTGNALGNTLNGGAGNDRLIGGDGIDFMTGGAGNDVFVAEINATKVASKAGAVSLDVVLDFGAGDKIDLSGIDANANLAGDQAFTFVGHAAGKGVGELSLQHFGNMNAAEKALGMELDGIDGASAFAGPVSVLVGNVDGGAYDFAMAFFGTPQIITSDLIL
jgi:serralysin